MGSPITAFTDIDGADVGHRPDANRTASLLLAAGEDEWRKEVDVGPMQFDEEGMPVVEKKGRKGEKASRDAGPKKRPWGVRMGFLPEINYHGDMEIEADQDGPVGGFMFTLMPGSGKFAFEVGLDLVDLKGFYGGGSGGGNEFSSFLLTGRLDGHYYVSSATAGTRFYVLGGVRLVQENVEIRNSFGDVALESTNSASGFGLGLGMRTGTFDFRFEIMEASNVNGVSMQWLTAAYRF